LPPHAADTARPSHGTSPVGRCETPHTPCRRPSPPRPVYVLATITPPRITLQRVLYMPACRHTPPTPPDRHTAHRPSAGVSHHTRPTAARAPRVLWTSWRRSHRTGSCSSVCCTRLLDATRRRHRHAATRPTARGRCESPHTPCCRPSPPRPVYVLSAVAPHRIMLQRVLHTLGGASRFQTLKLSHCLF